jgi:glycosyltransferase involved in cell wall biosynthesis
MRKLNVGVVTPQLSSYGGSEIYLLECLRRWQKDARITVYTPSFGKRLFTEFRIDSNVRVVRLPTSRTSDRRFRLFQEVVVMPRVWEQRLKQHDVYFLYLFPSQFIRRRPSVWFAAEPFRMLYDLRLHPKVGDSGVSVHVYPKARYDKLLVSDYDILLHLIEKADASAVYDRLAVNSRMTGRYIENIHGRKPDLVAYPGINLPPEGPPPSSFDKVLHVGRLWRHKRIDLIIKAMALTRSPNILLLAGDGPEKGRLRRLARSLDMGRKVKFLGDVTMQEREELFRECTCCVYTPLREPFGMVPLEAAAAARPVVATIGGGYAEILTKETAYLVPPYEGVIAKAIHNLMSDPSHAMKMGQAGRRIVRPHTWDRTAARLMDILIETADRTGKVWTGGRKGRAPARPIQLGAHYYPWYRAGKKPRHWNENREFAGVTDLPVGGPYNSTRLSIIDRHLGQASRAGLDFLVVNWQVGFKGVHPSDLEATRKLFDRVEKKGKDIRLAIMLALDTEDAQVALDAMRCIKNDFMPRPSYHRHRGRPFLWCFFNDAFQGFFFHYYKEVRALSRGVCPVVTGGIAFNKFLPKLLRHYFSGWCFYSPLEVGSTLMREDIWRESYRSFSEEKEKVRFFSISPGFDDSHLESEERAGKKLRRVVRAGLKTYRTMQKAALDLKPAPEYIVVTSFNEFHENTQIEPSKKYGSRYLQATGDFKKEILG